jgi:hypothetical protein
MSPILYVPWLVLVIVTLVACVIKYFDDRRPD